MTDVAGLNVALSKGKKKQKQLDASDDATQQQHHQQPSGRVKPGALSAFASLPVDIMAETMAFLRCDDLLKLSLTSKALRTTLETNPAIWRAARARDGVPDIKATDLNVIQYAHLIYDRACHCCGKKNIQKINHFFRARLCPSCATKQYVFDDDRTFRKLFQSLHPLTVYCVMCDRSRRVGKRQWRFDTYFKPALLGMSRLLHMRFPKPPNATHWHSRGGDDGQGDWAWAEDEDDEDAYYKQVQQWHNRPTRTRRRLRYDEDGNLIRNRSPEPQAPKLTCASRVQAFVAYQRSLLAARAQDAVILSKWELDRKASNK